MYVKYNILCFALFIFKLIQGLSGAENSVTHTVEEFQRAFQVYMNTA